jgi:hypothetical protein
MHISSRIRLAGIVTLWILVLAAPMTESVLKLAPERPLLGWTEKLAPMPSALAQGWFDKSLQAWASDHIATIMGFRSALVRTYNELQFRLFNEVAKVHVIRGQHHGLYVLDHLRRMNERVQDRSAHQRSFDLQAKQLRVVQEYLASKDKYFIVVLAASKPYVYFEDAPKRYVASGLDKSLVNMASFANALRAQGVNVLDSALRLRKLAQGGVVTHPDSGAHWTYYSACVIASDMLDMARSAQLPQAPKLDCGKPIYRAPEGSDGDVFNLMNIWTDGGVVNQTPFPVIVPSEEAGRPLNILVIGDSFFEQMRPALTSGKVYNSLIHAGYFRTRVVHGKTLGSVVSLEGPETDQTRLRNEVNADLEAADLVLLEMVDSNQGRNSYDWAAYMCKLIAAERRQSGICD